MYNPIHSTRIILFFLGIFYSSFVFGMEDTPLLSVSEPVRTTRHTVADSRGGAAIAGSEISGGDFRGITAGESVVFGNQIGQLTQIDEVRMDVSGHARVTLGDYFDTSTHVYQTLATSPHKELFEQMKPESLRGFASHAALVLEFEVAAKDFSETMGPGLTSSLYPKALNVYERLSHRGHPIASERYGDHLLLAVQVAIDRNVMSASLFCPPIDYLLGIKQTKALTLM